MLLNGWPSCYADVVDFGNYLYDAADKCWKSCPDVDKRLILASTLAAIAVGLNQLSYDIRKDVEDEEKKS